MVALPRPLLFTPAAEDACEERGAAYVGLDGGSGRYADPVPEGGRCVPAAGHSPVEVEVDFFAASEGLNAILSWAYRLACLLIPIGLAYALGSRLAQAREAGRR
jgi:hypothetical protein